MDETSKGGLHNCYLDWRGRSINDEPMFYFRKDGTCVANLDGYAVIPRKKYEQMQAALQEIADDPCIEAEGNRQIACAALADGQQGDEK